MSVKVVRGMSFIGLLLSFLSITLGGLPTASASLIGPLTVQITSPASDSQIPAGTVTISGTAAAIFILAVEVTIDGSFPGYRLATPAAPGDWSTWSIDYELPAGAHYFLARVTALNGQEWDSVGVIGTSMSPLGSDKDCSELPVRDFRGVSFIDESLARRKTGGLSSSAQYVIESMQHIKANGFTAMSPLQLGVIRLQFDRVY